MILFEKEIKKRLMNSCLYEIGRTCDMLELTFRPCKTDSSISEVFHIQSPFRILCDDHILTSDRDIYVAHDRDIENYSYYSTERNSEFDFLVNDKTLLFKNAVLSDVTISPYGDISIEMHCEQSDLIINCFNNTTENNDESWRFFRHHSDLPHIVCYRDYITEE